MSGMDMLVKPEKIASNVSDYKPSKNNPTRAEYNWDGRQECKYRGVAAPLHQIWNIVTENSQKNVDPDKEDLPQWVTQTEEPQI